MSSLTVVSNRLPIVLQEEPSGQWQAGPASGGLVQAMRPILQQSGGSWVGWPGVASEALSGDGPERALRACSREAGCELVPVWLSESEVAGHYAGFANGTLWPLFHGMPDRACFRPDEWDAYCAVNRKFARQTAAHLPGDADREVWIHDYHLLRVGEELREAGAPGRFGFFLHIPFPTMENYVRLPWRAELLRALLAYDLVGFQTERDSRDFLECVDRLMPDVSVQWGPELARVETSRGATWVGAFPIGIDFDDFSSRASCAEVARRAHSLREQIGRYDVILGVDRLDYTKGLLERLLAYERALERYPELRGRVVLFQVIVPSRESVDEYRALKREIDRLIGRITGRFTTAGWSPIRYLYDKVDPITLSSLYRLASVGLVTPLRDGMNLVAKEYCASQIHLGGVLVLSEMTGAAAQLAEGALLVNPHHADQLAEAIYRAVIMPERERAERMRRCRARVAESDVYGWAERFLGALSEPHLAEPEHLEYVPTIEMAPGSPR